MAKQFTLAKGERLKSRKIIKQLFEEGNSVRIAPYRIYYHLSQNPLPSKDPAQAGHIAPETQNLQFGVGVSKKNFKRAVDRNRIKRLTREAFRLQKLPLQHKLEEKKVHLDVFFIYVEKELPQYKNLSEKLTVALQKLIAQIEQTDQ